MHDLRARRELREIPGDAVVESQPDGDDHVGALDRPVHVHFAVHARHAQVQRVALRERTDPEQRRDDRHAGPLGEGAHFGICVRQDDSVPDHH